MEGMNGAPVNQTRINETRMNETRMNDAGLSEAGLYKAGSNETRAAEVPVKASIFRLTVVHVAKDLRLELRSRDVLNAMLFFALLVVVVFSFSFDPDLEESRHMVGGLFWVAFLFSSIMALNQSWARELRNGVLDAFRVSAAPAEALFLGKCIGNFL